MDYAEPNNLYAECLDDVHRQLKDNKLSFLYVNTRSLKKSKRKDNISELIIGLPVKMDVICMSETWIEESEKHLHRIYGFNGYFSCRPANGKKKRGGGCAVFTSENFPFSSSELTEMNDNYYFQSNLIKTIDNIEIIVASMYRQHGKIEMTNCFLNFLDSFLSGNRHKKVILCGDTNINMKVFTKTTKRYLEIVKDHHFKIVNTIPTREDSLIDQIITNFNVKWNIVTFPFVVSNDRLDHKAIILQCNRII